MAAAAANQSLAVDAVPEGPSQHKGGYRLQIFDKKEDKDKFSCGYCGKILRDPVQANCGHRFCTLCQKAIEEAGSKGNTVLCKFCKEEGCSDDESKLDATQMFPDRGIKREMTNIATKCPNDMCVWTGPFKDYTKHEGECKFQPLICEKCGELVSKQKMDQHKNRECPQRIIKCEHCHAEMAQAQKLQHLKECSKVPESCNQCSKSVPRDKMKKHKTQECTNRNVSCPLEGCGGEQSLGRFQQHVQKDQPKHLAWVLNRVADMEESLATMAQSGAGGDAAAGGRQTAMGSLAERVEILKGKLEQLEEQLQRSIRQGGSSVVGGATGASNQASGGAEASATGGEGSPVERINAMEFKVNSLEPILSVLHGEMNRCIGAIEALEGKLATESRQARDTQQKIASYEQTISTMTTSLSTREAKVRELEARVANLCQDKPDGTLLWKISNFSQVRQDAIAGNVSNIHSRPFFTGPLGYKMCVRLYPNGDGMGKGTHLSLFFTLMRSNHDALLSWPFKQKVYFMLIDQNFKKHIVDAFRSEPNSSSFQRPTSEMNIATGCPLFMQLNKLNQPGHGYLKDDTLFLRVVVETDGLDDHIKQFDPRSVPIATGTS